MHFFPRLIAAAIGIALFQCALPAGAATFNVTRFDDPIPDGCIARDCSLREAVIAANMTAIEDTILLQAGIYDLTQTTAVSDEQSYDLDVFQPLRIEGMGVASTTIRNAAPDTEQAQHSRVIEVVDSGLTIKGVTLRDGNVHHSQPSPVGTIITGRGGCISASSSDLTLEDVRITNCSARATGGGITFTYSPLVENNLSMEDTLIDFNTVAEDGGFGYGGGVSLYGQSGNFNTAEFKNVTIRANSASSGGGLTAHSVEVMSGSNVLISENFAASNGGGLNLSAPSASGMRIEWANDSRISDNIALGSGGGIHMSGKFEIVPSSYPGDLLMIEGNQANGTGGGIFVGAVPSFSALNLSASRLGLRMNTADEDGGGLYSEGKVSIRDSEFAFNSAGDDGGGAMLVGGVTGNLIQRSSFADNHAADAGGAVFNATDGAKLRNVSMYSNDAQKGGGVYAASAIDTYLTHVSSYTDTASQGKSLYVADNGRARLRNSALHGSCYKQDNNTPLQPGQIFNYGGNAQRIGAVEDSCAGNAYWSLGMSYGAFGGYFDVVGISSGSVLKNLTGLPLLEAQTDVRNWDRDAQADSGAFEFGAAAD